MRLRQFTLIVLLAVFGLQRGSAFSLLGPFKVWQTVDVGYNLPDEIGGPVLPSEGFRWNSPTIYYGFDRAFIQYFGSNGVAAVEAAIALLNALPAPSAMSADLSEYPLNTRQVNNAVSSLGIYDLKSLVLSTMLEELGVASAENFVWSLRTRRLINNTTNYSVIKLNYDPVTLRPSSYVNGALYTYEVVEGTFPTINGPVQGAVAAEIKLADLRTRGYTSVASGRGVGADPVFSAEQDPFTGDLTFSSGTFSSGEYVLGLTRDDVGALRRLYSRNTLAVEDLSLDTLASTTSGGGGPWDIPIIVTNGVTITNNFLALRGGREKVTFKRVEYDSLIGNVFQPFNYTYTDTYIQGGQFKSRQATRTIIRPDILFTVGDIGVSATLLPVFSTRTPTTFWRSFTAVNRDPTFSVSGVVQDVGPGVIEGPIDITFNSLLPVYFNVPSANTEADAFFFAWGSFDGSADAPVIYPTFGDLSVSLLTRLATGGANGGASTPWDIAPFLTVTTNGTGQVTAGTGAGGGTTP
ncbi:MAG: hypothetical protein HYR88_18690 [Verrucomicrobia bacterium]|nr:hypothetical protein [Verrucomicrobiota bacterium]MBI3870750.1 hypothetical protein [Verrucomicrobiota bacterium]